jgi:putative ABC transport system permease protein
MFARLLWESFRRQRRRKLLAGLGIMLGMTAVVAMLAIGANVGDQLNRELSNTYGANIVVYPEAARMAVNVGGVAMPVQAGPKRGSGLLQESSLPKLKQIFWRNNIVAVSPELSASASLVTSDADAGASNVPVLGTWFHHALESGANSITTGAPQTHPWWKLRGAWPAEGQSGEIAMGATLAAKLGVNAGDNVMLAGQPARVTGIVSTGDADDAKVIAPIATAQQIDDAPGAVDRVLVSALTKPEDALARRNPETLSPKMRDRWYCSPYANSISYQIGEAIPGAHAEPIRMIAQGEGQILSRISGLMWLVAIGALLAAILAVSAAMTTAILERREEIALMRSLGATERVVFLLFLAEAAVLAVVASTIGFLFGTMLARLVGHSIFATAVPMNPALWPIAAGLGLIIAFAATLGPIRRTLASGLALAIRGEA